jgi:4-amino-4-deoxy-L-arabinose transferase-like glycosyltransferase
MTIALIPIVFVLLLFTMSTSTQRHYAQVLIYSSVALGMVVVVSNEALSYFAVLNHTSILLLWSGLSVLLIIHLVFSGQNFSLNAINRARVMFQHLGWDETLYLCVIGIVVGITFLVAWVSPPNTFDSMTYHMSRVMHWVQNGSVDFYPTPILRQLLSAPWAEYAILQAVLLSGNDRFANLIQWSSMVGSIVIVAGLAKELGANRRGQIFAALFCATLPMGILQSTSTQNDYVVGFWLVCCGYQVLGYYRSKKAIDAIVLSLALGLAVLTKPTAYIYAAPLIAWIIIYSLYERKAKATITLCGCLLLAVLVNLGHYYRNYDFSGTPLGQTLDTGDYSYENAAFGPRVTVSNILRNIGLHLESRTSFDGLAQRSIERVHKLLQISIADQRTTWPEYAFRVQGRKPHEDYAGNLWHTLLVLLIIATYFFWTKRDARITGYVLSLLVAFLLFCTLLRWQPWHSRLQLPLYILWAPVVGLLLGRAHNVRLATIVSLKLPLLAKKIPIVGIALSAPQRIKVTYITAFLLVVGAVPFIISSETKPLIGQRNIFNTARASQLFYGAPHLAEGYLKAAELVSEAKCTKIGLFGFSNDWEYPVWVLVQRGVESPLEVRHVAGAIVSPRGAPMASSGINKEFIPCAILTPHSVSQNSLTIAGQDFRQVFSSRSVNIYR